MWNFGPIQPVCVLEIMGKVEKMQPLIENSEEIFPSWKVKTNGNWGKQKSWQFLPNEPDYESKCKLSNYIS